MTVGQLAGEARVEIKKGALAGVELGGASADSRHAHLSDSAEGSSIFGKDTPIRERASR